MAQRITEKDLKEAIAELADSTQQDLTLDQAYGGNKVQVKNAQGGYADFLGTGFVTKKELFNAICHFARGFDTGHHVAAQQVK